MLITRMATRTCECWGNQPKPWQSTSARGPNYTQVAVAQIGGDEEKLRPPIQRVSGEALEGLVGSGPRLSSSTS